MGGSVFANLGVRKEPQAPVGLGGSITGGLEGAVAKLVQTALSNVHSQGEGRFTALLLPMLSKM